ncbi:pseudaminic acid cytidylyltransferase [Paracrocinitomix mangrovi]|uniref:pseudaminic acid cytidylyltransferase n=1 Tax=Paracrocinitomix mangrovi TaxID=2862509 RepID=UPI001C8EE14C|nr:pseudaminic acid cytidylyltransferase [Paracrocinitomix mangrovi]UKN02781.1 pseudaminic acid cytidylyltransferase [Paracrocinitomix mangrovi]
MKSLCVIPARGGSKRIPRKNIRDFLGKPIIAYSIETAINSGLFDEVMVSTDDPEIARIAEEYGAKVPFFRSEENANDFATTVDVLKEVFEMYKQKGQEFDIACCIYPTAPFVSEKRLIEAREKLISNSYDAVFPVLRFSFPIQRALKIKDDKIEMFQPENMLARSQDLEPAFHDAGQFYFFVPQVIINAGTMWTSNTSCIEISDLEAQDIDNETDWEIAEFKYSFNK